MAMSRMMMVTVMTTARTMSALLCDEYAEQIRGALGKRPGVRAALEELQGCLEVILAVGVPEEPKS